MITNIRLNRETTPWWYQLGDKSRSQLGAKVFCGIVTSLFHDDTFDEALQKNLRVSVFFTPLQSFSIGNVENRELLLAVSVR